MPVSFLNDEQDRRYWALGWRASAGAAYVGFLFRYYSDPILTKPIDWDLIRQQYDQMVKYATALRLGTAETEAILRRFTRNSGAAPSTTPPHDLT